MRPEVRGLVRDGGEYSNRPRADSNWTDDDRCQPASALFLLDGVGAHMPFEEAVAA